MPIRLTEYGVETESLQTLIKEWEKDLQTEFANPKLTVEDNENLGHLVKVLANRENLTSQAIQQVYASQTVNGAENVFLDEMLAFRGVFREKATAGSGNVIVETSNVINGTQIIEGSIVTTSNDSGIQYITLADQLVADNVVGYKITKEDLDIGVYNFIITNRVKNTSHTKSITLGTNSDVDKLTFLNTLKDFLQTVNIEEQNIYVDTDLIQLTYGVVSEELIGISESVNFYLNLPVGTRYTSVPATALTKGYYPLNVDEVVSISPEPHGFQSVRNITKFSSGTEVETDAAYLERANAISNSPKSSTATAVRAALLERVAGVETVIISKVINSSENDRVEVTPIIIGGSDLEVATVLEDTQPINNVYYGDVSVTIPTADGDEEIIRFSRGQTRNLDLRVSYTTVKNTILTESEKATITSNLIAFGEEWGIGDKIFNAQLQSAAFSGVGYGRFKTLKIEIKGTDEPDTSFSEWDYQAGVTELPDLLADNINYIFTV